MRVSPFCDDLPSQRLARLLTHLCSIMVESIMSLPSERPSRNRAAMNSSEQLILAAPLGGGCHLERRGGIAERRAIGRNERASSGDLLRASTPSPALQRPTPDSSWSEGVAP